MKNYTITVNGTVYDVTVEEGTGSAAPAAAKLLLRPLSRQHQRLQVQVLLRLTHQCQVRSFL